MSGTSSEEPRAAGGRKYARPEMHHPLDKGAGIGKAAAACVSTSSLVLPAQEASGLVKLGRKYPRERRDVHAQPENQG